MESVIFSQLIGERGEDLALDDRLAVALEIEAEDLLGEQLEVRPLEPGRNPFPSSLDPKD